MGIYVIFKLLGGEKIMNKIYNIKNKELMTIILGRDGGKNTIKILDELLKEPQNAHQLSKKLDLNYNTILHHIEIITEYDYITMNTLKKKTFYYPSNKLINNIDEYKIIKKYVKK